MKLMSGHAFHVFDEPYLSFKEWRCEGTGRGISAFRLICKCVCSCRPQDVASRRQGCVEESTSTHSIATTCGPSGDSSIATSQALKSYHRKQCATISSYQVDNVPVTGGGSRNKILVKQRHNPVHSSHGKLTSSSLMGDFLGLMFLTLNKGWP